MTWPTLHCRWPAEATVTCAPLCISWQQLSASQACQALHGASWQQAHSRLLATAAAAQLHWSMQQRLLAFQCGSLTSTQLAVNTVSHCCICCWCCRHVLPHLHLRGAHPVLQLSWQGPAQPPVGLKPLHALQPAGGSSRAGCWWQLAACCAWLRACQDCAVLVAAASLMRQAACRRCRIASCCIW